MKMISLVVAMLTGLGAGPAFGARAVEWKNLDAQHYLGGRKASAGYLLGKVVLVNRWGARCPPCRKHLPEVEKLWQNFKMKSFVVLGGHCPGWGEPEEVNRLVAENELTYPIYEDAGLGNGEPVFNGIPFLYVVDATGTVVYRGRDEKAATQAIVTALTDLDAPRNLSQWKRFLDYELEHLPAQAYLRMAEFRKRFPKESLAYGERFRELAALRDVKPVSELVAFAKRAKDAPAFGPKEKTNRDKYQALVREVLNRDAGLKNVADHRLAQEAKNALADLTWTAAGF